MKKNIAIVVLVLVIIAGGAIWFAWFGSKNQAGKLQPAPQSASENKLMEKPAVGAKNEIAPKPAQTLIAKVKYDCDGGRTVYAWFYKDGKIEAAPGQMPEPNGRVKINLDDGRNFELAQTISADGGRYANAGESLIFWDKGGTALILENGKEYYTNCAIDISYSKDSEVNPLSKNFDGGITIGNEYKGYFEKEKYYYPIGNGSKINFVHNPDSQDSDKRWSGNVILEKGGKNFVLLENIRVSGPGGDDCEVWMTNNQNILLLSCRDGDLGWWYRQDYYLDLAKNKIVLKINNGSGYSLSVQKGDSPENKIGLLIAGECKEIGQRAGDKVQITDLTLNGKAVGVLEKPIEFGCDDEAMFGPGYDVAIDFEQTKIESDFSKFYFVLKGTKWDGENKVQAELWKKEFYIPLDNPNNIKIYPNN